jgi:NAD(P)-dependent dehydrogenase (short-subunit alcohol dehydrogenase family)
VGVLDGKMAMVTGATSGIGRTVALAFAREGARVVGCGRDAAALDLLAAELGARGFSQRCDVTNEAEIESAVAAAVERFGGLDIAFNCAGMSGLSFVKDADLEVAENIWRTNVLGILACMKHQSRAMIARGSGSIINVSSASGTQVATGLSAYSSSKAALDMLTRTAAVELGEHQIRVNALAPGTTITRMTSWTKLPGVEDAIAAVTPLGRLGRKDDMVGLALLLASDAGSFITGQVLNVDGGLAIPAFPDLRKLLPGV